MPLGYPAANPSGTLQLPSVRFARSTTVTGVTRRLWYTTVGDTLKLTKADPVTLSNANVTARRAGGPSPFDAVWVNGERSWDTYVFVDGEMAYHSPVESVGDASFGAHEAGAEHAV